MMNKNQITDLFKRLSFGGGNMIAPGDNGFSFRIEGFPAGIPKDVHFTFGYSMRTGDINLHVTRNVPVQAPDRKPYVKVAIVHKDALLSSMPILAAKLVKAHLIPVLFFNRQGKTKYRVYEKRKFLDLGNIEQWSNYKEGDFKTEAVKHIRKKGGQRKYEMQPTFGAGLQEWTKTKIRLKAMRAAIKPISHLNLTNTTWGFLFSVEYNGPAVISNERIYVMRTDLEPADIAKVLFGKEIAKKLERKIGEAIGKVRDAKTHDEISEPGDPIRLFSESNPNRLNNEFGEPRIF